MLRTDIINLLIKSIKAKKYLEIGISDGINFSKVNCDYKVGVDPETSATFQMTSDDFFDQNKEKFDVIFVDGLHHADQVYRDIINSLNVLNDNGYIVCHDMNPTSEEHQTIPYTGGIWNGDCWKAFVTLRGRDDLKMCVVDTDYGCGIIQKGQQKSLSISQELTWENFNKNKTEWLNLISIDNFIKEYNTFDGDVLGNLILDYISNPENPQTNFVLGSYYESIGQTASAISYYLRCAERTEDNLLKYECLLRGAICFTRQGTRNFTVKGFLLHALSICPQRPEAYYLMSIFHEVENKDGSWNESYTMACMGLNVPDLNPPSLSSDVGYPGEYGLLLQKAKSGWWCGLCEESRDTFSYLLKNYEMDSNSKQSTIDNLKKFNVNLDELLNEEKEMTIILEDLEEKIDTVKKDFDWGEIQEDEWFLKVVTDEIFIQNIYQKFFEVEKDDLVVDVGASVGPFTYSILNKEPQKVYCFEPHKNLFKTLSSNLEFASDKVTLINKGIADANGEIVFKGLYNKESNEMWSKEDVADAMTFKTFIDSYNIKKIDFLKTDCEGGEYDIFTEENFDWIKKNVKKITGEWHLHNDYLKDKFRKFRDLYLKEMPNHQVYSMDGVDIKWSLWDDWFINYYGTITVWIENDIFEWGEVFDNEFFRDVVEDEVFQKKIYEKFFEVEEGDIVFDVGASVGPFPHSILNKNPQKIYCFEPHKLVFKTLEKNIKTDKAVLINKAIGGEDGYLTLCGIHNQDNILPKVIQVQESLGINEIQEVESVKFKTFIDQNNIEKIDFLKTDSEGGEYDIFNDENLPWIKKNVKKITGEWHLDTPSLKAKFRHFRNTYLKDFPNYEIYSYWGTDIKWSVWDDWFIDYYDTISIWIDNRTTYPWMDNQSDETADSFDWGLFEKNDLLAKCIKKEFDGEANYEKFFSVQENDVVFDIGASVGPFTKSILDKNPKLVLCLEPHPRLFETLNNNFSEFDNVKCINKGISSKDGEVIFENLFDDTKGFDYVGDDLWKKTEKGIGITFRSLIKENHIEKIDFLKIDCEGGEYDVFTLDNFYWIKNNVKKIAGEWHLGDDNLRKKFLDFRDFYLRKFDNFKVFFVDADSNFFDVTDEIWSNDFVMKYGWINIYIENE